MKYFLSSILLLFFGSATLAQTNIISSGTDSLMFKNQGVKSMVIAPDGTVRIGTVKAMDNSALLQINSNTKGLLIPGLTTAQRDAIAGPANGLLIYNVTTNEFNYYNGSAWSVFYPANNSWGLTGNAGTDTATNFIGTTDLKGIKFKINSMQAGRIDTGSVFLGYRAGTKNTDKTNVGIGNGALMRNTTGYQNTANGYNSLYRNTMGNYNTANGYNSLYSNTTGYYNTASGYRSIYSNTTGNYNTASGSYSLYNNTTGIYNTANGYASLNSNTMGGSNTASGNYSLRNNTGGKFNTAFGDSALLTNTTGTNNSALGYFANVGSNNLTNATAIGAMAYVTTNNSMVLGSINGQNGATANTNVGIGTTAPSQALSVAEKFQVDINGNIVKINNVTTSFPAANVGGYLSNDGSGNLTWSNAGILSGGASNYLARWTGGNTLSTGTIQDDGACVGIGVIPNSSYKLYATSSTGAHAVYAENTGSGNAVIGWASGTGRSGYFVTSNTANTTTTLEAITSGSGLALSTSMSGAKTGAVTTASIANSSTSSTASINKTGLSVSSTGAWNGTFANNIGLNVNVSGGTNNYAALFNGGNVGIGTTAPLTKLQVIDTTTLTSSSNVIGSLLRVGGSGGARVVGVYGHARGSGSGGKSIGVAAVADYMNTPTDAIGLYAGFNSTPGGLPASLGASAAVWAVGNGVSAAAGVFQNGGIVAGYGAATLTSPGTNTAIALSNGHLKSQQTTTPTIIKGGTSALTGVSVSGTSTDVKGLINTVGNITNTQTETFTLSYNLAYGSAPVVVITPANAATANLKYAVTASASGSFTITINNSSGATQATPSFYYMVIE